MITDPLEPLSHVSNWSRNLQTSLIVNLRFGLANTTEVFIGGSSGFKLAGRVWAFEVKTLQKVVKKRGGGYQGCLMPQNVFRGVMKGFWWI